MPESEAKPVVRDHRTSVTVRDHRGDVVVRDHRDQRGTVVVTTRRPGTQTTTRRPGTQRPRVRVTTRVEVPTRVPVRRPQPTIPRDELRYPYTSQSRATDTILYADPNNSAVTYYLPRYRTAQQVVSGRQQYRVALEAGEQGGRLVVHLEKYAAPEIKEAAAAAQELPHEITVALKYQIQVGGTGSGEKQLLFQEVTAEEGGVLASLHLPTLDELTQVFQVMTQAHYDATLSVRRAFKVAVSVTTMTQ
jgi:hypothetical protein